MARKKKGSRPWMQRHVRDPYVQKARQQGYRARAAFKLIEILDRESLLRRGDVVVDLGAAPGSWSQVVRERLARPGGVEAGIDGCVIALDLLPMDPIADVTFLQGDFREEAVLAQLVDCLGGRAVDLVISDMAPNLSGVAPADAARMAHVCELALEFACAHLQPQGALIVKAFHGSGFSQIVEAFRKRFHRVVERKPDASRNASAETFIVGRTLRVPG